MARHSCSAIAELQTTQQQLLSWIACMEWICGYVLHAAVGRASHGMHRLLGWSPTSQACVIIPSTHSCCVQVLGMTFGHQQMVQTRLYSYIISAAPQVRPSGGREGGRGFAGKA